MCIMIILLTVNIFNFINQYNTKYAKYQKNSSFTNVSTITIAYCNNMDESFEHHTMKWEYV
jgi:hypothetical protein